MKKWFPLLLITLLIACKPAEDGRENFVLIHEIIPNVEYDIRYHGTDNFVGASVDGYINPVAYITKEAGNSLVKVQKELNETGMGIKVFDAYRPQKAVDHFVRWGNDPADTLTKDKYYPYVNKAEVFELGYVATKSGHSRGSTIDLTIINLDSKNELDMGSAWDYFNEASNHGSTLIDSISTANREILRLVMLKHGFKQYDNEWWHYTLKDEPYPQTYFNFDVR